MAKLNVWFARGFSDRVRSVDLPEKAVKVVDGKRVTQVEYFKRDPLRFQAYLKGYNSAAAMFHNDSNPDHEPVVSSESINWNDARKRPTLYPLFLMVAEEMNIPEITNQDLCPSKVVAPLF